MADLSQLESALTKADAAGNVADAKVFADEIRRMRASQSEQPQGRSVPDQVASKEEYGTLRNIGMGALKGASDIGATLLSPIDKVIGKTNRRQQLGEFFGEYADPDSIAFNVGELGSQIAGTAGVGGAMAKGAMAIPKAAKYAQLLSSGGFNLGNAATGSKLANLLLRASGGAVQGGVAAGMINPEYADTGAMIGGALPGMTQVGGIAGNAISKGFKAGSRKLMQSALKPTIEQLRTGKAATAIDTLLDNGINATSGGADRLRGMIDDLNNQVANRIENSGATVSKQKIIDALRDVKQNFSTQVSPTSDLVAIGGVADDFAAHPLLPNDQIPVQLAQQMKQGTYKVLNGKYGEAGSASTEAQKALARGLKDEIASAVPDIAGLNAQESKLITTLGVVERRALMDANKNPMGLALLSKNPVMWGAFMADKSAAFKSIAARLANNASKATSAATNSPVLTNMAQNYGRLVAPAAVSTANP